MTNETKMFLSSLAQLCERYDAQFTYTQDDDGVHVLLPGKEDVNIGLGTSEDIRKALLLEHNKGGA